MICTGAEPKSPPAGRESQTMTVDPTVVPQFLEAAMLVCFGISWPIDILKTLRTRVTAGKSLGFMSMVFLGYCLGMSAKFIAASHAGRPLEPVFIMYALNALFVATDIVLTVKFSRAASGEVSRE